MPTCVLIGLALPMPEAAVATNVEPVIKPLPEIAPVGALNITGWFPALSGDVKVMLPEVDVNVVAPPLVMPLTLGLPNGAPPVTTVSLIDPRFVKLKAPPVEAAKFEIELADAKVAGPVVCIAKPNAVIVLVCVMPASPLRNTSPEPVEIGWLIVNVLPVPALSKTPWLFVFTPLNPRSEASSAGSLMVRLLELVNISDPAPIKSAARKEILLPAFFRLTPPFVANTNSPFGATTLLPID